MAHDIFISHSSKDKTTADAACACLESRGLRCWIAPRDIVAGADWSESIIDGINGAKVMVLILSSHSNVSKQVLREIERAANRGIAVLPFRVEDIQLSKSLEYFLSSAHWLDAYHGPLKHNLERLANNVAVVVEKQDAVRPLADPPLPSRWREMVGPASLWLSLLAIGSVLVLVILRPKALPLQSALLVGFFVGPLLSIVSGVVGLLQRGQKKRAAFLGTTVSLLTLCATWTLLRPAIVEAWNSAQSDDSPPPAPAGPFADPAGTITNSLGMKLVPIQPDEFLMGTPADSPFDSANEQFQHKVRITKPFFIGMHEVTQYQYEQVTGENPSYFKGPDLPVEHVSWSHAQRFSEKLTALPAESEAGRRYRLPTEAEWEYACRAGTVGSYNTGESLESHQARLATTSRSSPKQTARVGTYPPNAWGVFDMHGNVWEWTSDWFSANYFHHSPVDDPPGPGKGTHHTLRGGSASVEAHECHTAIRGEATADEPETVTGRYSFYGDFGIRVICEVQ